MKNSNYIAESVFRINLKYTQLQNETKELFFYCLNNNKDLEYFKGKIEQIWGNLDHTFMDDEIGEYEELIHEQNMQGREIEQVKKQNAYFALVPVAVMIATEKKFVKIKEREYKNSLKSYAYKHDKEEYLKLKVAKYTDQIVPYYKKSTNEIVRYVQLSTYNSMIHNTNLTRSGWNTTLNDADILDNQYFTIPYHPFSCPYCIAHQGKRLSRKEIMRFLGKEAMEQEGDILHPNCKCTLTFYEGSVYKSRYSKSELNNQYEIRQKVNSLTLKKEQVKTDMKIQSRLGNQDEVDKLNQQRNKINKEIRNLKDELPTESLKKQVVAINR